MGFNAENDVAIVAKAANTGVEMKLKQLVASEKKAAVTMV